MLSRRFRSRSVQQRAGNRAFERPEAAIITHGQHKSTGKTRRWAATQGKAQMMDDQIEPRRSPRPRRQSPVLEALGENTSTAQNCIATKAARHDHQANLPPRQRQIGEAPLSATPSRTFDRGGSILA